MVAPNHDTSGGQDPPKSPMVNISFQEKISTPPNNKETAKPLCSIKIANKDTPLADVVSPLGDMDRDFPPLPQAKVKWYTAWDAREAPTPAPAEADPLHQQMRSKKTFKGERGAPHPVSYSRATNNNTGA